MFCEPLESRRLLSITLNDGTVIVNGGKDADVVSIIPVQGDLRVTMMRGSTLEFEVYKASRVDAIRIHTKGGNDTVSVPWFDFNGRTVVHAGKDHDNVNLSVKGKSSLFGGAGSDVLRGGSGNDLIKGQAGNDVLTGAEGNDTLIGGAGGDRFDGQGGKDLLKGRDNRTDVAFTGGDGRDTVELDLGKDIADDPDSIEDFLFLNGIEIIA